MDREHLNKPSKLLIAALRLEEKGKLSYRKEDLAVSAWHEFPDAFGMNGYKNLHPDLHIVTFCVSGVKGMVSQGLLNKPKPNVFSLTVQGREKAYSIAETCGIQFTKEILNAQPRHLKASDEDTLIRILQSPALHKYLAGTHHEISIVEAADFWGFIPTPKDDADRWISCRRLFMQQMDTVACVQSQLREIILSNGRSVVRQDIHKILELDTLLWQRFCKMVEVLKCRKKKE